MDPLLDRRAAPTRDPQKLDPVSKRLRKLDIERGNPPNALRIDIFKIHAASERNRCQDRQLVRCIDAIDIETRIGLGVSQRLSIGKNIVKLTPCLAHRGQDVVTGTVQNTVKTGNPVTREPFPKGLDNRNPPRYSRFVTNRYALCLSGQRQCGSMMGNQRLVGGHNGSTAIDRRFTDRFCRAVGAANQLDNDVGLCLSSHFLRIVKPLKSIQRNAAIARPVACRYGGNHDRTATASRKQLPVFFNQAEKPHANRPKAGNCNPDSIAQETGALCRALSITLSASERKRRMLRAAC